MFDQDDRKTQFFSLILLCRIIEKSGLYFHFLFKIIEISWIYPFLIKIIEKPRLSPHLLFKITEKPRVN